MSFGNDFNYVLFEVIMKILLENNSMQIQY